MVLHAILLFGCLCTMSIHSALSTGAFSSSLLLPPSPSPSPSTLHHLRKPSFTFPLLSRSHHFPFSLLLPPHLQVDQPTKMSSRRSRISQEEISELISKLQSLLPETRRRGAGRASAAKLLKETCNYIKSLNREVDDLSDHLSALMASMDSNSAEAELVRSLLRSSS